jgi:biofilm protein TabA
MWKPMTALLGGLLMVASGGSGAGDEEACVASESLARWRTAKGTEGLEAAFAFLEGADLMSLPLGRIAIEGDQVFAIVSEAETRPPEAARFEAHRTYVDVQYLVSGQETIGVAPVVTLKSSEPYDAARDIEFFATPEKHSAIELRAGRFAVFAPDEGHMPSVHLAGPHLVRKVVVKVSVVTREKRRAAPATR